jgi:glycosyltransferase involved in cell wall biosynthesis
MNAVIAQAPSESSAPRVLGTCNPAVRFDGDPAALPRITVLTPCLNHADYLEACIRSVLDQGYPNLEYVIMDGGSTDGSVDIIRRYEQRLARWRTGRDRGHFDAVNQGFTASSGELMAWIGADDMLQKNSLWTAAAIFQQFPDVDWITGHPTSYDAAGRTFVHDVVPRWSRYRLLRGDYQWIQQESCMWRRRLWDRAGGHLNEQYAVAAELELWMRFFRHAKLFTTTALLAGFRQTRNQKSKQFNELYREEAERIIASEPISEHDRKTLAQLARFDRLWFRLPVVGKSWRVRQAYERLFDFPPVISFDHATESFHMRPSRR